MLLLLLILILHSWLARLMHVGLRSCAIRLRSRVLVWLQWL